MPEPGSAGSTFPGTFVPFDSMGGVRFGDTYGAVKAAHGEPNAFVGPIDFSVGDAVYGPTTPWGLQFGFLDADGDGQLSSPDTVWAFTGSDDDTKGLFKFAGVGTGSTEAEVISVIGSPFDRNVNHLDSALTSLEYFRDGFSKMMVFNFKNGVCNGIMMITDH